MQTLNSSPHAEVASLENDKTSQQISHSPLEMDFSPLEMNFSSSKVKFSPLEISLKDLHFYAYHGVLPQERVVGGRFTMQIHLMVQPSLDAILHDNLEGTVHFPQVVCATVEVQKDNPPMGAALSGCSVRLSASRAEAPI